MDSPDPPLTTINADTWGRDRPCHDPLDSAIPSGVLSAVKFGGGPGFPTLLKISGADRATTASSPVPHEFGSEGRN